MGYQIAPLFHLSASLHTQMKIRLLLLIGNVLKTDSKTKPTSKLNCRVIIVIYKLGCQECKNLLEQLRAMNEHDETAPFSLQHINKTHGCLFFIIVIIKNMQLISYPSKTGLVMGRAVRSDVGYPFNLTLLQKYELTWKYFYL